MFCLTDKQNQPEMNKLCLLLLFCCVKIGYGQKTPILHMGKKQLALSSLDVKVNITGNIATTTYDMLFYNPSSRVLEGELKFPLAENQEISRLALEMNGKLREGVVVDKELGRIAFEGIVRRGVDPALLEKGKGNTYNIRVYPIPARGYKRVVIGYEQELLFKENAHYYHLPLNFKDRLDRFKVAIEIINQNKKPIVVEGEETMLFSNWKNTFKTSFKKENYIPNNSILVRIPIDLGGEKLITSKNYFYFYKTLKPKLKKRDTPKSISLYWDASLSMKDRDLAKEIELLDVYFKKLKNLEIDLVSFSNTVSIRERFSVRNGNWVLLKEKLTTTIYDGATSYSEIEKIEEKSDVILLCSDGFSTLSEASFAKQIPVFTINSKTTAAHKVLYRIGEETNGSYVDLNTSSLKEALSSLTYLPLKYLGHSSKTKNIEVYPSIISKGLFDFSVAGKNYINGEKIIFFFGYGNDISMEIPVILKTVALTTGDKIKRIWAKNKLGTLLEKKKENKKEITDLATNYGLVTDYTSLIVLESVHDYVKYKITPPSELLAEYNRLKSDIEQIVRNARTSNILPPPSPERIEIVEDEKEVEETVIESTETDESESVIIEEIVEVEESEEVVEDVSFMIIEEAPVYPGCLGTKAEKKACFSQEIKKHFQRNFNFALANELDLSIGRKRILIRFKINREGFVEDVKARAPHLRLKNEAIRVVKLLPQIVPARQSGRTVAVSYTLPLTIIVNANGEIDSSIVVSSTSIDTTPVNTVKKAFYKKYKGSLDVVNRIPKTVYLNALSYFKDKESAYLFYLTQRESYKNIPHYYIDVSDYFYREFKAKIYAKRILSNVAELDTDSYQLLRAYAYKLEERNENDLAVFIYQRVLELRPEDVQSYRDLALAYQNVGLCQKAFDLFLSIVTKSIYKENKHRRFFIGLHNIAEQEMKFLIKKFKEDLDLSKIPKEYISDVVPMDLRVIVDWNHNDTDIDLHIIDPNLEECYYNHPKTVQGGLMSKDMTQGFGPESFTLKEAKKGFYFIKIKYFGDRKQKIETPTFMKVTIFKNQGKVNEEKRVQVIRLSKNDSEEVIAKIEF